MHKTLHPLSIRPYTLFRGSYSAGRSVPVFTFKRVQAFIFLNHLLFPFNRAFCCVLKYILKKWKSFHVCYDKGDRAVFEVVT
jgi:hypothetical protein